MSFLGGYALLRVSHYRHEDRTERFIEDLRAIGRELHLLETVRLYMDGGQSMQRVLEQLHELTKRFQDLIQQSE